MITKTANWYLLKEADEDGMRGKLVSGFNTAKDAIGRWWLGPSTGEKVQNRIGSGVNAVKNFASKQLSDIGRGWRDLGKFIIRDKELLRRLHKPTAEELADMHQKSVAFGEQLKILRDKKMYEAKARRAANVANALSGIANWYNKAEAETIKQFNRARNYLQQQGRNISARVNANVQRMPVDYGIEEEE